MADFSRKIVLDRTAKPVQRRTTEWRVGNQVTRLRYEHASDGIVWANDNNTYELINCALSDDEYRFYLTYFDQIDIPLIPAEDFNYSEPVWEYLRDIGFLVHTVAGDPEGWAAYCWSVQEVIPDFLNAPLTAIEERNEIEPGTWSLSSRYRQLKPNTGLMQDALELELFEMLPVPSSTNTFSDIVEYKRRYNDELQRLRVTLHNLYQRTLADVDVARSINNVTAELSVAVSDVKRSMESFGLLPFEISIKTDLDLKTLTTVAASYAYLTAHHVPSLLSLPLAGTAAALSVKQKKAAKEVIVKGSPVDFSYVIGFDKFFSR